MIRQAYGEVGHLRIGVGNVPAWVGEESVNPFLDEIIDIPDGKMHVCIAYKTYAAKINGSTLFTIDNMYYINFRIQKQDSVPWCYEIQNQILEILGNTLNLHSNSIYTQKIRSLNQFI